MQSILRINVRTLRYTLSRHSYSSSSSSSGASLRRSYLYVPSSSPKMLAKSLTVKSDMLIYDLEDSVAPQSKAQARSDLLSFLSVPSVERISVRVNDITTPYFEDDVKAILSLPSVNTLILPKVHSVESLNRVSDIALGLGRTVTLIPSIESARALWDLGAIASWSSTSCSLGALLFAAEDYCADTSIIRTPTRQELLYTRSQIVIAAKAFGLDAIDMVCVNYQDVDYLRDECLDGRRLGFTGKQAIHPSQVEIIQETFVPTHQEILRAAKILHSLNVGHANQRGAVGLDGEMIDAPMLKQAQKTIRIAKSAGLKIPII